MRYRFFDKHNLGEPFIYLHPYKQKEVYDTLQSLGDDIDLMIIFGSATQLYCHEHSDIDVCVVSSNPEPRVSFETSACDILAYPSVAELRRLKNAPEYNIEKSIWQQGVVVHAK